MMNYYSTIDFYNQDEEIPICNPANFKLQYYSRMIIILLSFLSSSFIGLTCILSSKRSYWTFRIISFQSLFECIDLGLAFIYNRFFMQQETLEKQCNIIGYIMHSSWLSSFCCCLFIIYQLRLLLKVDNLYETLSKNVFKVIFLFWIASYVWLLFPFLQEEFVPTGWNSFKKDCIQYFFCGFSKSWKIYLIFWTIPQIIIFVSGIILAKKNSKLAAIHLSTFQDEEFEIIQHLQLFPIIYGLAWLFNQLIRYTDIIDVFVKWIVFNDWPYAFYVFFNLIFELHLIIVLSFFLYNYNQVLNIKQIWLSALCCRKKVEINDNESLLYQDVNGTS